jgi:hypothetical protein
VADEPPHDRMPHDHARIGETGRHAHVHTGPGHMGAEHSHMHDHVAEQYPAVNYILVEVRERDPHSPVRDTAYLRSRLHEVVTSLGLDAADMIIRPDRLPDRWQQARDLLAAVTGRRRPPAAGDIPLGLHPAERPGRRAELRPARDRPR